jgi:hypothetical protein
MTIVEGLTIFALIAGPVVAVYVTRWFDRSRAAKERQLDVFRELMRTRRGTLALSPDHVKALNLVEIEFYGSSSVLDAHRALLGHFYAADGALASTIQNGLSSIPPFLANYSPQWPLSLAMDALNSLTFSAAAMLQPCGNR